MAVFGTPISTRIKMLTPRAQLYQALAEAIADPPEWLAFPGRRWPLYRAATQLASVSQAAGREAKAIARINAESLVERQRRYASILGNNGEQLLWTYESGALHGGLLGPETFEVERWYHAAGVGIIGAELPDHASVELSFLAYLAGMDQKEALRIEREFIRQHAGRWLPRLGRMLATSGDPVYAPIGRLMAGWLEETSHPPRVGGAPLRAKGQRNRFFSLWPVIDQVEECTLCGFCVQACPAGALTIHETNDTTDLMLYSQACIGCGKCERICETRALIMKESPIDGSHMAGWHTLRQSRRVACTRCGVPMVSQAEFDYMAVRLENPSWLKYCTDCRQSLFG
jgi:ferredoxin